VFEIVEEDATPLAAGSGSLQRQRGGERRDCADQGGGESDPDGNASGLDGHQSRHLIAIALPSS
jgi:hypothetical protein